MNVRRIRASDIVRCDVRGQQFFARVVEKPAPREKVQVEPLLPTMHTPTQFVTSRQIIEHYSKRKGLGNGNGQDD